MGLSLDETRRKIEAYERGTSSDLAGIAEPTVERLKAQRAQREEMRQVYEAKQAAEAERRESLLRARYLSAGGTPEGWQRDKSRILSDDAVGAMHRHSGGLLTREQYLA